MFLLLHSRLLLFSPLALDDAVYVRSSHIDLFILYRNQLCGCATTRRVFDVKRGNLICYLPLQYGLSVYVQWYSSTYVRLMYSVSHSLSPERKILQVRALVTTELVCGLTICLALLLCYKGSTVYRRPILGLQYKSRQTDRECYRESPIKWTLSYSCYECYRHSDDDVFIMWST